jgi:hypothetical protein
MRDVVSVQRVNRHQRGEPLATRIALTCVALICLALRFNPADATPAPSPDATPSPDAETPLAQLGAGAHQVDLGLVMSPPVALEVGEMVAIGAGYTKLGERLNFGLRLGYAQLGESNLLWRVTHQELRLSGLFGVRGTIGRARLSLGVGLSAVGVREVRLRHQSARLSESGDTLTLTSHLLAGEVLVEAEVALPIYAGFGLILRGGPVYRVVADSPQESPWGLMSAWSIFWRSAL